jgi:hypothetical protein
MSAPIDTSLRDLLQSLEIKSDEAYDNMVSTLSGGALGLSVVFIDRIVPTGQAASLWLVIVARVLWVISLILVGLSLRLSARMMRMGIRNIYASRNLHRAFDRRHPPAIRPVAFSKHRLCGCDSR